MTKKALPMRTVSASDIGMAFKALHSAIEELRRMLGDSSLPAWVYPESDNPRQSAIDRLCRLWEQDGLGSTREAFLQQTGAVQLEYQCGSECESGIVCVDQATFDHVAIVNEAKNHFRELCEQMAAEDKAINGTSKGGVGDERKRNTALAIAFRSMGISQIKLRWCYNKIHTIDQPVYRIGFTWQRNHSDRKRLTRDEAISFCHKSKEPVADDTLRTWEDKLLSYPPDAFFVRCKDKGNQQRANYVFTKGGVNNTLVTPAVVVILSDTLPTRYNAKPLNDVSKNKFDRADKIYSHKTDLGFRGLHVLPREMWAEEANKRMKLKGRV